MIVNRKSLLRSAPIKNMIDHKVIHNGVSYGLSEAGYDIRIKQEVLFNPKYSRYEEGHYTNVSGHPHARRFIIASAIEEFQMPPNLVGIVHDKSTWARQGLSVFNTVIEPGWDGFLTLELTYHGNGVLKIPAGSGIAQVVFHRTTDEVSYNGKYQNQPDMPVEAKFEGVV